MPSAPARRVGSFDELTQAGDYYGPAAVAGYADEPHERPMVWFLLPIHEGADKFDHASRGSGVHGVTEPPWTFRECADGSLEIRASIACGRHEPEGEYWHGYLNEGNVWTWD